MSPPAVATIGPDSVDQVAAVHRDAFPESALSLLGGEAVRRYYRWQFGGPHNLVALGAFDGDRLVGFCLGGTFRGAFSGFVRSNRWFLARSVLARPWLARRAAVRDRSRRAVTLVAGPPVPASPRAPVSSFGVLVVAVADTHRRRGAGRSLLAAAEAAAAARSFERMHLTVDPANETAAGFYAACGWARGADGVLEKRIVPAPAPER